MHVPDELQVHAFAGSRHQQLQMRRIGLQHIHVALQRFRKQRRFYFIRPDLRRVRTMRRTCFLRPPLLQPASSTVFTRTTRRQASSLTGIDHDAFGQRHSRVLDVRRRDTFTGSQAFLRHFHFNRQPGRRIRIRRVRRHSQRRRKRQVVHNQSSRPAHPSDRASQKLSLDEPRLLSQLSIVNVVFNGPSHDVGIVNNGRGDLPTAL